MTTKDDATPYLPRGRSVTTLRRAVGRCRGCELFEDATQGVFGAGSSTPRLVFVGEQPGDIEDQRGEPFVGPAGRLLDEVIVEVGLEPADIYKTNAVKHFRFEYRGKRRIHAKPAARHLRACRPWLIAELEALEPEGVVLLGASAGAALYGQRFRVGESRGISLDPPPRAAFSWAVATTHPSAVLRSRHRDDDRRRLVEDLRVAADQLGRS